MAKDLNQFTFTGRLGSDPESRAVGDTTVCNFSVAIGDQWKDKQGNKQERTDWIRVAAWGNLAQICQSYLVKGKQVLIVGKVKLEKYTDKDSGKELTSMTVVADNMQMIGGRDDAPQHSPQSQQSAPQGQPQGQSGGGDDFSDSIPF